MIRIIPNICVFVFCSIVLLYVSYTGKGNLTLAAIGALLSAAGLFVTYRGNKNGNA